MTRRIMGADFLRVTSTALGGTRGGFSLSRGLLTCAALLLAATLVSGCGSWFGKKKEVGEV
ncbi:MAG TPA: hypothetical protein VF090_01735, partial [Methyloceanibacter sp.]